MSFERIHSEGVVYLCDSGERAPMSVVWTTLPGISVLLPFIGHVGIADTRGIIYDFSGPYQVTVASLMGGPAKRIWRLDPSKITITSGKSPDEAYDRAVTDAACVYGKKMHNLILDNCHSHVALVLNNLGYNGRSDWNQVKVFKSVWLEGKWAAPKERFAVFAPSFEAQHTITSPPQWSYEVLRFMDTHLKKRDHGRQNLRRREAH